MRYIKEINGKLKEYNGLGVSSRFLIEQGYIKTNLSEPLNVLKIENNKIVLKTEDELLNDLNANDKFEIHNIYKQNQGLIESVKKLKKILDLINLDYTLKPITPLSIIIAINNTSFINDKSTFISNTFSLIENEILLNIKLLNISNPETFLFNNIHKLIKYLPE